MTIKIKGKTLLVVLVGVGTVATAYLAAKKTPEAQKRKEEALQKKREETGNENAELTFIESAKAQAGCYIPVAVAFAATIGSLIGSEVINEANLKKAEKKIDDFKDMVDRIDGKGSSKIIEKAVEQKKIDDKSGQTQTGKEWFRITFQDQVVEFQSTKADVLEGLYEANRYFQLKGMLTFNEFLECFKCEPMKGGDDRGWEAYVGEAVYGYTWIDFYLNQDEGNPSFTDIDFAVYPHPFEEDEAYAEIDEFCKKKITDGSDKDNPDSNPPW